MDRSTRGQRISASICRICSKDTPWHTPWMERVLPVIATIAEAHAEQTIFTRFIPPERPEGRPGCWRAYYERWRAMTRECLHPGLLDLVSPLDRLVPPAVVVDKPVYSAFAAAQLRELLVQRRIEALVVTGAETDVGRAGERDGGGRPWLPRGAGD
jgi:nicotinamidase-related amidase